MKSSGIKSSLLLPRTEDQRMVLKRKDTQARQ